MKQSEAWITNGVRPQKGVQTLEASRTRREVKWCMHANRSSYCHQNRTRNGVAKRSPHERLKE
eukprot:8132166-Pyramimonas_sp.AAC.1